MKAAFFLATLSLALAAGAQQATAPSQPDSEQIVVTVLGPHNGPAPAIAENQIQVKAGHDHPTVTGWTACTGANAKLDLAIVLDDDTKNIGSRLTDIRDFIQQLPPTTAVSIVYLHTATIEVAQSFTLDHVRATAALRDPIGTDGLSPSPFGSLRVLMARWPRQAGIRREMVIFSDGVEHVGPTGSHNPVFEAAVNEAAAGGIVAYSVFVTGASTTQMGGGGNGGGGGGGGGSMLGRKDRDADIGGGGTAGTFGRTAGNQGNVNLSILADATGARAYSQGDATPPRLTPFLDEIAARLQSQYLLDFTANPESDHGAVDLKIEAKGVKAEIIAPNQIRVNP